MNESALVELARQVALKGDATCLRVVCRLKEPRPVRYELVDGERAGKLERREEQEEQQEQQEQQQEGKSAQS